jgi:ubiquinone biosynthesis protein COQ9
MDRSKATAYHLQKLIDHPATPQAEREAARLALRRVLKLDEPKPPHLKDFKSIFRRSLSGKYG